MKIRFFDKETGKTALDQKQYRIDFKGNVYFCIVGNKKYNSSNIDLVPALNMPALNMGWEIIKE